jgi:signal transduction histidine kinase
VKPHFGPMTRTVRPSAAPLQSDTPGRKFELPAARDPALDERRRAFLRAISHELRTPLTSIIGFSEIIAAELYGPLGAPQYREYAEHVRRSGRRLLKLVNQVLEIARLEGGEADMALTPQPLVHLLDDVGDLLREDLLARNGRIVVADESDLPTVRVDARAARDLLFNLIQNALLHGPVDGAVEIRARQEGYQVVIEIHRTPARASIRRTAPRPAHPFPTRRPLQPDDPAYRAGLADRQAAGRGHGRRTGAVLG